MINTNRVKATAFELKAKSDTLNERATKVAQLLQKVTAGIADRPQAAQEAFCMAELDLHLLSVLSGVFETAVEQAMAFADYAQELDRAHCRIALGVSPDVYSRAMIRDLVRQIDLIQTFVVRAEASLMETSGPHPA